MLRWFLQQSLGLLKSRYKNGLPYIYPLKQYWPTVFEELWRCIKGGQMKVLFYKKYDKSRWKRDQRLIEEMWSPVSLRDLLARVLPTVL